MYLPTFQKLTMELAMRKGRSVGLAVGVGFVTFGTSVMWNHLYNFVYTDIYPPASGVIRRIEEED